MQNGCLDLDVHLERNARKALELSAGRTFGDREWEQMRRKLIEFYAILRGWDTEGPQQQGDKESLKAD